MIKTFKIFERVKRQKVLISGDNLIAIPVKACPLPSSWQLRTSPRPLRSAGMRQACIVANRAQRQQQEVHAYSIIVRTTSPAHPQGCFSSLPEIQTVLSCLHIFPSRDLPFQPDASARESIRGRRQHPVTSTHISPTSMTRPS